MSGCDLDVLPLQVEALGATGFEVAAWLETRNIFLELATREVRLPDMVSGLHHLMCPRPDNTLKVVFSCYRNNAGRELAP